MADEHTNVTNAYDPREAYAHYREAAEACRVTCSITHTWRKGGEDARPFLIILLRKKVEYEKWLMDQGYTQELELATITEDPIVLYNTRRAMDRDFRFEDTDERRYFEDRLDYFIAEREALRARQLEADMRLERESMCLMM